MAEEIAAENGRIFNFGGLVTLTLDRVILHTIMHYLSTSTCVPNFVEIEETFCGRTYVQCTYPTYLRTDEYLRPALLDGLCLRDSRPKNRYAPNTSLRCPLNMILSPLLLSWIMY